MTAETPGRAAYEAHHGTTCCPWDELPAPDRKFWESIAQAAIAAQEPKPAPGTELGFMDVTADRDRYHEALQRIVDADPSNAVDKLARNALGLTCVPRPKKPNQEAELLRARAASLLAQFQPTGSGHVARMTAVNVARSYAGFQLPLPDDLKHLEGQ